MKQKHGNNRNAQIPEVVVYIYWDWRDQWLLQHAITRWSWEKTGALGSHIKIKDRSRLSLWQQIRKIESSTRILREVYSRHRRENPTDLHTPQTLARHSSQRPGGKRKTRNSSKNNRPSRHTQNYNNPKPKLQKKRMHTSPQHSSSHSKHTHKKKTSKGHALLLPNPGTLPPVMAMEKDEANYNKQLTGRIPFSQQKLITCANEEGQITRWLVLTNARRRFKTRQ
jgi:hypothetical protein